MKVKIAKLAIEQILQTLYHERMNPSIQARLGVKRRFVLGCLKKEKKKAIE